MSAAYELVNIRPRGLDPQVVRVWTDSFQNAGDMASKLAWFYDEAPAGAGQLWVVMARDGDAGAVPVGGMGFGLRDWKAGGREAQAGLMADLAVLRAHRTVQPALKLARTIASHVRTHTDFGYGFPNHSSMGVIRRGGCRDLGLVVRYARVLRSERYLRRVLGSSVPVRPLANLLDTTRAVVTSVRAHASSRDWRLVRVSSVDGRFDQLWQRASRDYDFVGRRDAAFVTWRFLRHPWTDFEIWALCRSDRDEELDGYAVVERRDTLVYVRDLFCQRARLGPLLDLVLAEASLQGIAAVSMCCLADSALSLAAQSRGLSARDQGRPVLICPAAADVTANPGLFDPKSWHLTEADEDV